METVFKKNEDIFLPKDAVSPLGGLMPAVYQEVARQGPGTRPLGLGWSGPSCLLPGGSGAMGTAGPLWWPPWPTLPRAIWQLAPSEHHPCAGDSAGQLRASLPQWSPRIPASVAPRIPASVVPQHPHTAAVLSLFLGEKAELTEVVNCHGHPESVPEPDSHWAPMSHHLRPHTYLPEPPSEGGSNAGASLQPLRT